MKDIGLKLKEKREENGLSLEEVSDDLNIRKSLLEALEDGKKEFFKDVFTLKYSIRDYAKYLGLDGDALLDEFNEYLFVETSKISLEDIARAKKEKEEHEKDMKILSPYTRTTKDKKRICFLILFCVILVIFIFICYILVSKNNDDDFTDRNVYIEWVNRDEFS